MDHGDKYIPPDFSVKRLHEGLNINGTEPHFFAHPRHIGGRLRKHPHSHRAGHRRHHRGHHEHRNRHQEHHRGHRPHKHIANSHGRH